jgi:hypothetical protein
MTEHAREANVIAADPSTSYWLRDALTTAFERDAIDALSDAETLYLVLLGHVRELLPPHLMARRHNAN